MKNLTLMKCCVCEDNFKANDDVVVCPDCGAPYHRECYIKNGSCVYSDKHKSGFEYEPPIPQGKENRCANCGTDNISTNLFCENCGNPMREVSADSQNPNTTNTQNINMQGSSFGGINNNSAHQSQENSFETYMAKNVYGKGFDGISTQEWTDYIGSSSQYYLYQFARMDEKRNKFKLTFCWSALLFSTFYFAYRKMYNWALLSALGAFIVNIPTTITFLNELGIGFVPNISASAMQTLSLISMILSWALGAFFCLFSFYLYRQHAVKKIKKLKSKNLNEQDYSVTLKAQGGASVLSIVAIILFLFAISFVITSYVGSENIYALYDLYY